jgi:choline/glycine/proline betaine transport protein
MEFKKLRMKVNPFVFFVSAAVVLVFVLLAAIQPQRVEAAFGWLQNAILDQLGWFYIIVVAFFLLFVLWLWISPYGQIRLGGDDEQPEYSTATWFAMLFSAGMGIGLLFFSVAEPIMHMTSPPAGESGGVDAARQAMNITFFHWGLHAWAIYIVVGLSLAFFAYRHGLPLTIRSTLYPLLGDRIHGRIGDVVEIMAVFGTVFGVATSLGLGAMQINAGLRHLGLMEMSTNNQVILIVVITLAATASVVSGLNVGIRRLSELNMVLGLLLVLFVAVLAGPAFILGSLVQGIGRYIQYLPEMTFRTDAFIGPDWQKSWTMFYWGWWISWSPFVGMFIARVSRGRTIRAFITGVLLAPTLLAFLWIVTFGNTAMRFELAGNHAISSAVAESVPTALYVLLAQLPWTGLMAAIATIVIATYFITSSDSASLVIDILTSNGELNPPVGQRIFWALTEGAVAVALLLVGGLVALQTAAITTALPFSIIMLMMCWSLLKGLRGESMPAEISTATVPGAAAHGGAAHAAPVPVGPPPADPPPQWRQQLRQLIDRRNHQAGVGTDAPGHPLNGQVRERMADFIDGPVHRAFDTVRRELESLGRQVDIVQHRYQATLTVRRDGREEFTYTIRCRLQRRMAFAFPQQDPMPSPGRPWADVVIRGGGGSRHPIDAWTEGGLVRNFLNEYAKWIGW